MVHHIDLRRQGTPAGPPQHTESGRRVVLVRQWISDCHSLLDRIRVSRGGCLLCTEQMYVYERMIKKLQNFLIHVKQILG